MHLNQEIMLTDNYTQAFNLNVIRDHCSCSADKTLTEVKKRLYMTC